MKATKKNIQQAAATQRSLVSWMVEYGAANAVTNHWGYSVLECIQTAQFLLTDAALYRGGARQLSYDAAIKELDAASDTLGVCYRWQRRNKREMAR